MKFESETNQEYFEQLKFVLTQRTEPTLILVSAETSAKRAEVYEQFKERFTDYNHITFHIENEEMVSLEQWLTKKLPKTEPSEYISEMVHIFGLGSHFHLLDNEKLAPSSLLPQINMERELLFRDIPAVLVWWLDKYQIATLRQEAPDLWSWITYQFHFEAEEKLNIHDITWMKPIVENIHNALESGSNSLLIEATTKARLKLREYYNSLDKNILQPLTLISVEASLLKALAGTSFLHGEFENAEVDYKQLIPRVRQLNGKMEDYPSNLITSLCMQNKLQEASNFVDEAIEFTEEKYHAEIFHWKGVIYDSKKLYKDAIDYFLKSLDLAQKYNNTTYLKASYIRLAESYISIHRYADARTLLMNVLNNMVCSVKLKHQLQEKIALTYEKEGNQELANQYYKKADELKKAIEEKNPTKKD